MDRDSRIQAIESWLDDQLQGDGYKLEPASADASFRRYFRVTTKDGTSIVMDAPPEKEDSHPFIQLAKVLRGIGVNVPEVLHENFKEGFFLLSDLGKQHYLSVLSSENVDALYSAAMQTLLLIQKKGPTDVPAYDKTRLMDEMNLYPHWYIDQHLDYTLTGDEHDVLQDAFELLCQSALSQPQVCVHRDYHSRNLMIGINNPGVLDFQDAVYGPITYDLVSLLRDCYIEWPQEQVYQWVEQYYLLLLEHDLIRDVSLETFTQWFDLMGIQRHLKVVGIFSRLNYRDNKPAYMHDIPLTTKYIITIAQKYPRLTAFAELVKKLSELDQHGQ